RPLLRGDGLGVLGRAVRASRVALLAPAAAIPRRRRPTDHRLRRPRRSRHAEHAGAPASAARGGGPVGHLSRKVEATPCREAGDLCPVEAIDREGLVVTSEGALLRVLRAAPKNPLVMSAVE